ncbi:hypothetical protein PJL18_01613 [Paenarthrobacter nicotinovorans]|nr:hypothetical protein [Paenarthrobacter nicotinovorans]
MLPECCDALVGGHDGIEGIAAHVRGRRSVGRNAMEGDLHVADRQGGKRGDLVLAGERVQHHHRVNVVEGARPGHEFLAVSVFFGRRAEEHH